ncbi:MAG: glycosyltransferase family 87 protein [Bacteroidales bacterium]
MAAPLRDDVAVYAVTGLATATLSIAVVHAVATILRAAFGGHPEPIPAWQLTSWSLFLGAMALLLCATRRRGSLARFLPALVALSGCLVVARSSPVAAMSLFATWIGQVAACSLVAARLSTAFKGKTRIGTTALVAWVALALVMLVQVARLTTYMADPTVDWWLTTRDELWARHMCMPAYVEAADLQRRNVPNVYDAAHYPALVRDAKPSLTVDHIEMFVGDPFQYPPPFLLAPLAALRLTNDFLVMRTVWYVVQLLGMVGVALLLSAWVGGTEGRRAAWLLPLLIVSIPAMQALQYGQFHLAALLLGVSAMIAFERGRPVTGGALLAATILSKIFPGILLILLVAQKRWREAAWTTAFIGLFTALAVLVLGPAPFHTFVSYQLPRLANGQAFAFADQWPELRLPIVVIGNLSPTGLLAKLQELGVARLSEVAGGLMRRAYDLLLIGLVLWGARRPRSRRETAAVWLALLNLGALEGYAAWGDYVTVGTVWLLTLFADERRGSRFTLALLGTAWVLCALVPGVQPIPSPLPVVVALVLTSAITIAVVVTNTWAIVHASSTSPGSS